ncbi:MAG TPA: hypothetical protein VGY66_35470 [Gemmataceae bacterium]|jgi:hypothetical protein|nr:hypothetical protein [Gemmataceae bacterium]
MLSRPVLRHILENDALTRGLADPEARILVEWLVDRAELAAARAPNEEIVQARVQLLCRRGRAIGRFVELWCHTRSRGAAGQLAAAERFTWPFPSTAEDPCEIMQTILDWESDHALPEIPE